MSATNCEIRYEELKFPIISASPSSELRAVVVIPSYAEPSLLSVLSSLQECHFSHGKFEVIVLLNESSTHPQSSKDINRAAYNELIKSIFENLIVHVIYVREIPEKISGVGLARKIAMDEAVHRLKGIGSIQNGVIINLDADCTVSENYVEEILNFFLGNPDIELGNIHFEHPFENAENLLLRRAIVAYECHLRVFIGRQRRLGLPFAFQTIGSAFAVRSDAYQQVGGMNKRKAGEDFYFIHKFSKKGTIGDIQSCSVFPSGRVSNRVPFGTGKAVGELVNSEMEMKTYHPSSFALLVPLIRNIPVMYEGEGESWIEGLDDIVVSFLDDLEFRSVLKNLKKNTKRFISFEKAFYQWFDAFKLMKYLHFVRDRKYSDIEIHRSVGEFLGREVESDTNLEKELIELRELDKGGKVE